MSAAPEELVRERRVARATGLEVELVDAAHPDCKDYEEEEGGRWVTVCPAHGGFVQHTTWRLARKFLGHPEEWCPVCQGAEPAEAPSPGFSEEERQRGLETRRKKSAERQKAREEEKARKDRGAVLAKQWQDWTLSIPFVEPAYSEEEKKRSDALRDELVDLRSKIHAAKRGRDQADSSLADLPQPKTKREKKNQARLEEESSSLDAVVTSSEDAIRGIEAERSTLYRIALMRAILSIEGWTLEKEQDGGAMTVKGGDRIIRVPDDYLPGVEWPKVRAAVEDGARV